MPSRHYLMNKLEKSAIVFVCGRTNVGKSSVINAICETKKTITSHRPDTTRQKVFIPYASDLGQLIIIDSPGINYRRDQLSKKLNRVSMNSLKDNDIIYYVTDRKKTKQDELLLNKIKQLNIPIFLVINKIDNLASKARIDEIILSFTSDNFKEYIPISAKTKQNINQLLKITFDYAIAQGPIFLTDFSSSLSNKEMILELIREKIFYYTDDELPYATFLTFDYIKDRDYYITIVVEKENQKKILLGSNASIIKKIRLQATRDIKRFLGLNITLNLFVKVIPDWRNNPSVVSTLKLDHE